MEAIMKSQAQLEYLVLQKMDAMQAELKKSPSSSNTTVLAADFSSFHSFVLAALKSLQEQITILARESDSQEMRCRRKIVLIHGIPEQGQEDTAAITLNAITQQMKLTDITAADITRCHRMGRASTPDKPRPIILKLRDLAIRNNIWFAKTTLKGTGITISEFLTKPRHAAFIAARQRFGLNKCWTRDGFVLVLASDGSRHRISSITELNKIEDPPSAPKSPKPSVAKNKELVAAVRSRRAAVVSKK